MFYNNMAKKKWGLCTTQFSLSSKQVAKFNLSLSYIGFLQKLLKMTITDVHRLSNLTYGTNRIRGL